MTPDNTTLFDLGKPQAHARATDPLTSHLAAASVTNIRTSQTLLLGWLQALGPMTDEEIFTRVNRNMSPSGARTRRSELVRDGYVRDSGQRKTTASGRKTIVWEAIA